MIIIIIIIKSMNVIYMYMYETTTNNRVEVSYFLCMFALKLKYDCTLMMCSKVFQNLIGILSVDCVICVCNMRDFVGFLS